MGAPQGMAKASSLFGLHIFDFRIHVKAYHLQMGSNEYAVVGCST